MVGARTRVGIFMFEFGSEGRQLAGCDVDGSSSREHFAAGLVAAGVSEIASNASSSHAFLPNLQISSSFCESDGGWGTAHLTKKKHEFDVHRYLSAGAAPAEEKRSLPWPQANRPASETHSVLVGELAFAFMLSLAGASRRRPDLDLRITDPDDEEGQTTSRDPHRLSLAATEHASPARQQLPMLDKFSWSKAMRPLAASNTGITFDARSSLLDHNPIFSAVELQSKLAAASVTSWWKNQTGDQRLMNDITPYPGTSAKLDANPNYRPRSTMIFGLYDTLADVARELFHDETLAWLIADLNKGSIKEHIINGKRIVRLKHRQAIVLPHWLDVVEFNNARPELSRSVRVVTLVEKTRVDIDLLKLGLTSVVGCADNSPA